MKMPETLRMIRIDGTFVFDRNWTALEIAACLELLKVLTRQILLICRMHSNPSIALRHLDDLAGLIWSRYLNDDDFPF